MELTDSVRLLDEAGLIRFDLCCCCCCFRLSIPLDSKGVRLLFGGDSRRLGASCRRREDLPWDIWSSETTERVLGGGCCTFATIPRFSRSYCCTVFWGPIVNNVAVGPWLASPRTPSIVGIGSYVTCFVRTSHDHVSLSKVSKFSFTGEDVL